MAQMSIRKTHPGLVDKWHPTKNAGLNLDEYSYGSQQQVWWYCPKKCPEGCEHEWFCSFNDMTSKGKIKDCPRCHNNPPPCEHSYISYTHKEIMKEWHPTKNGDKLPSKMLASDHTKVWWVCPKKCSLGCEHEYEASIYSRCSLNSGCPICAGQKAGCEHNSIKHTHPDLAKSWHPTKNLPVQLAEVMAGSSSKRWWLCDKICPKGCPHEWAATVSSRTRPNGCGCPHCSRKGKGVYDCVHARIPFTHPWLVTEWDTALNGEMKPEDFKSGSNQIVHWKCALGHTWSVKIKSRTSFITGCPVCVCKTEQLVHEWILRWFPSVIREFTLEGCINILPLPFDFCIPEVKTIIEIDGRQHFAQVHNWVTPEDTLERDVFKMNKAYDAGYRVIRVFQEDVYAGRDSWLEKYLLPEINSTDRDFTFMSNTPELYNDHIRLYQEH